MVVLITHSNVLEMLKLWQVEMNSIVGTNNLLTILNLACCSRISTQRFVTKSEVSFNEKLNLSLTFSLRRLGCQCYYRCCRQWTRNKNSSISISHWSNMERHSFWRLNRFVLREKIEQFHQLFQDGRVVIVFRRWQKM